MVCFSFQAQKMKDVQNISVLTLAHGFSFPSVDFLLEELEAKSSIGTNQLLKIFIF